MDMAKNEKAKERLEMIEYNANARLAEADVVVRDKDYYKRNVYVMPAPIFIATSEDVGTVRARAEHNSAHMHYCQEQIDLKLAKAPIT
mmetsp:Transcript_28828/g.27622  ORF Transcript_28828/g.27622 Transcript_28828/m.27622 type:complete len:88 (+) Transcript_28828:126-389(+)